MKPVKHGIKLWTRCDSKTSYVYDTNIYCGKDAEKLDGTLGERVVTQLVDSVQKKDVVFSSQVLHINKTAEYTAICSGWCIYEKQKRYTNTRSQIQRKR